MFHPRSNIDKRKGGFHGYDHPHSFYVHTVMCTIPGYTWSLVPPIDMHVIVAYERVFAHRVLQKRYPFA